MHSCTVFLYSDSVLHFKHDDVLFCTVNINCHLQRFIDTMSIAAQVSSHMVWGNGVYAHTVYRVDVNMAGETWSVYRRYSAFDALHQQVSMRKDYILCHIKYSTAKAD